jgi:hypothetical protein
MSKLLDKIEQLELGIGDKGYEGESRIITPFKGDYLTQQQRRFNKIVRRKRQIIERVNSRLKDFEISPISPLGRIKPFQKYKPQLKFLEIKKISNKST